ncbi:hypothetical protein [Ramlibacter albus]|uniref:DNA primase/polymerase bifunctional N-terminal domain-containing protein n=1 Tax=Ramlibacter albus TaxID=2079448 RepID=A0A923S5B5_9BURK|nr:hypothetical protein [Ramlibacter albus]MBC5767798.1 hypothetical protein [Ramlibacter albus]
MEDALHVRERLSMGGVGGLVSAGNPGLVGIDLDNVVGEAGLHPLALEAVEKFAGCYVEVSPSGTGLRIFTVGAVPAGTPTKATFGEAAGGKPVGVEMYAAGDGGRWLRCTGLPVVWQGRELDTVVECQAGIDWLASVLQRKGARSPDNGAGPDKDSAEGCFAALAELRPVSPASAVLDELRRRAAEKPRGKLASALRADLAPWGGDHSAADLFLCIQACRYGCDSQESVCEVWRGSDLSKRSKWKRHDYRTRTVSSASVAALDWMRKQVTTAPGQPAPTLPPGLEESLALSGDKLVKLRTGALAGEAGNIVVLFRNHPQMQGLVGFNALEGKPVRCGSWRLFDRCGAVEPGPITDADLTRLGAWLRREFQMSIDARELLRGVATAADDARFDPLADRLHALGAEKWLRKSEQRLQWKLRA